MSEARKVSLFRNGRNQAIRIPVEFELPGDEAFITKEGDRLIIESKPKRSLLDVLEWLREQGPLPMEERLPDIDDSDLPPLRDVDL